MPIDYRRLVEGLGGVTTMVADGSAVVAMEALVTTVRQASGAAGATFTEYGRVGGRVIVAQAAMAWALGQPVPAELVSPEVIAHPFAGLVEGLSAEASGPLLARGMGVVAGHPVRHGDEVIGALHLFFGGLDRAELPQISHVLRVAAACAEQISTGREPASVRSAGEDEDRSLFLAAAGHELRTPTTVLKGYARLLSDRWDTMTEADRRAAACVLADHSDELARLVERLLDTSVGDTSSDIFVHNVPFNMVDALLATARELPMEMRRYVRVELPNWLPPAKGDPNVLRTVVTELVTNAVRASGSDGSTVELSAGADADTVFLRVADRGSGIDPAQVEQAFERFWRASTRGGNGSGIGLGLYLVRRLVERQDGWVSLRPREGGGTIAEVRLGRADGPPHEMADRQASGRA
jgi:signal transduction histidine kinase